MKNHVIEYTGIGNVRLIEKPVRDELEKEEVLIRVKTCGICMSEIRSFSGKVHSKFPGYAGHEPVGIVEKVHSSVTGIKPGDNVAANFFPAFSEFIIVNERNVFRLPENISDFTLWMVEPAACAVNSVRNTGIEPGDRVVLVGCGYMGLLVLQVLPKNLTFKTVVVDLLEERMKLAMEFGADAAINSGVPDWQNKVKSVLGGPADVVIECTGFPGVLEKAMPLLRVNGLMNIFGWHTYDEPMPLSFWHTSGTRIINTSPSASKNWQKDFSDTVNLISAGKIDQKKLITHRYPMSDAQKALDFVSKNRDKALKAVFTLD